MRKIKKMLALFAVATLSVATVSFTATTSAYAETTETKSIDLFSGAAEAKYPWQLATTTLTTKAGGNFDPSSIKKDGYFHVEYTGEEGAVYLALGNWTNSTLPGWTSLNPSKSGKTETGFYSDFTFDDCAKAYKSEDFSDISAIYTGSASAAATITKFTWCSEAVKEDEEESKPTGINLYDGPVTATATAQNTNMAYFFSKHVGGTWDASKINKDSYFYVEYTGAKDGIYLALTSASGATNWVAVYPDETGLTESGSYYSLYKYDNFSKKFGTNFARLDQIQVYSNTNETVTLNNIKYFEGKGDPVDTTDGTWDRPDTGIAFLGDSIVQNALYSHGDWNTILGRDDCSNYGIGCQTTVQCERRINDVAKRHYEKVVMLCGINDLGGGITTDQTIANYKSMFSQIHEKNPNTKIYLISVLPTYPVFFNGAQFMMVNLNKAYKELSDEYDYVTYVDCHSSFVGEDGYCKDGLLVDGLHPNDKGYAIIADVLNPYLK